MKSMLKPSSKAAIAMGLTACLVASTASALTFTFEYACTDRAGVRYSFHTDFDGVIVSLASNASGDEHAVVAACEARSLIRLRGRSGLDANDIYDEMFRSEVAYSWSEVADRFSSFGYEVTSERFGQHFCLCQPNVVRSAKDPDWPHGERSGILTYNPKSAF